MDLSIDIERLRKDIKDYYEQPYLMDFQWQLWTLVK